MFDLVRTDSVAGNSNMKDIIPASQRLVGLLGVCPSESDITKIITTPFGITYTPDIFAIREIVLRLHQIYITEAKTFSLDVSKLLTEVIPIDFMRENSFFYEQILKQECGYIVSQPLNETSDIWAVLGTLVRWKQNPQMPHFAPIGVTLLMNLLLRFVIAGQQYRYKFDELLRIWIYTSPWTVIEETCYFVSQIAEVINEH